MKKLFTLICLLTGVNYSFAQSPYYMTTGSDITCSGDFYDIGGPTGDYIDNQNVHFTFYPLNPLDKISVSFTSFSTAHGDVLHVINGDNYQSDPEIAHLDGTVGPGTITSTAPDGSLTFLFITTNEVYGGSVVGAGWVATISCVPNDSIPHSATITMMSDGIYKTCTPIPFYDVGGPTNDYIDNQQTLVTFYPATQGEMVSVAFSSFSTAIGDVLYVFNGDTPWITSTQIAYLNGTVGPGTITSTAPNGSLTFLFQTTNETYNPTQDVGWAALVSCVPLYSAPPSGNISMMSSGTYQTCSANFYDVGGPNGNYIDNQNSIVTFKPVCSLSKVRVTFSSFVTTDNDVLRVYHGTGTGGTQAAYMENTVGPITITSNAPDGSLTFWFLTTNETYNPTQDDGWAASITTIATLGGTVTPSPSSVCSGNSSTLTLTGYTGCDIQWQSSPDGSSWTDIPNATLPTISTDPLTSNTYYHVLSNNLCSADVSSNSITVTVNNSIAPQILWNWPTLDCSPTGSNYQWYLDGILIPNATGQTYTPQLPNGNGDYTVAYTDGNGCRDTSASYTFTTVSITDNFMSNVSIYPNPTIGSFTIETTLLSSASIQTGIRNTLGQIVYSFSENANAGLYKKELKLDIADGVYYLQIKTEEGSYLKEIIVSK